jgi:hydrogenase/urease accessory protein HupE
MIGLDRQRTAARRFFALTGLAIALVTFATIFCLSLVPASCDEVRPAYLEVRETRQGEYTVLLETPMRGETRLSLHATFSGNTESITPVVTRTTGDAAVQTWRMRAPEPLAGQTVGIFGLDGTVSDALVRIQFADGNEWVQRLTPQRPTVVIPSQQTAGGVAAIYLKLGIEHILTGFDHLLFVLALLIISRTMWLLVKTITAFTLAHSITLALATLGYVQMPSRPVEAVIALSIVFVAVEIVHARQGREGLAARAPWIVAFTFGLLHGLGFAGALNEVGLPQGHIPTALLFFNVGVEIGQLMFVAAVSALVALLRWSRLRLPHGIELVPPYAIGSVAMFWVIQRVAVF